MAEKKINIFLVELRNTNLGDSLVMDSVTYCITHHYPLFYKKKFQLFHYNIFNEDYSILRNADLIIFDGGGVIKFKVEHFDEYVEKIVQVAEEYDIPVYFNAVGVEGYDAEDERCQLLKEALNKEQIKMIAVRDDLDTMRDYYLDGNEEKCTKVSYPSLIAEKVYEIKKDKTSKKIGLGIARSGLFADYSDGKIDENYQLDLWKNVIELLEEKGYDWQLFTNGMLRDQKFAEQVLDYIGRTAEKEKRLVNRPVEARELIERIAGYRGVIVYRMHAGIAACALRVPCVWIAWQNKLVMCGETLGCPERVITTDNLQAEKIVAAFEKALQDGPVALGRNKAVRPLKKFMKRYGKQALLAKEDSPKDGTWEKNLLAVALGGKDLKYKNLNVLESIEDNYEAGFRWFEADVRMTTDEHLVCINGWSKSSYKNLGIPFEQYGKEGMPYEEFMQSLWNDRFQTVDFEQLLQEIEKYSDANFVLDLGRPSREKQDDYVQVLGQTLKKYADVKKRLFLRVQSMEMVEKMKEFGVEIVYYLPARKNWKKEQTSVDIVIDYCKSKHIFYVSMPKEMCEEKVVKKLKKAKLKTIVFSFDHYDEVVEAQQMGVTLVGTSYLSPQIMNDLQNSGVKAVNKDE